MPPLDLYYRYASLWRNAKVALQSECLKCEFARHAEVKRKGRHRSRSMRLFQNNNMRLIPKCHPRLRYNNCVVVNPHACARGKAIVIIVGTKIATSRDLGIRRNRSKTGFSMLWFLWYGSWASQIVRFVGHAYRPCLVYGMCFCSCAQLA